MEKDNSKIITVSFVLAGFIAAIVVEVLLETMAASWGGFAKYYANDWVSHGAPLVAGFGIFAVLQFNKRIKAWADEVVTEVRKVVWPSRKDTVAMTVVTCVMLLVASVILGVFDFLSSNILQMIIN